MHVAGFGGQDSLVPWSKTTDGRGGLQTTSVGWLRRDLSKWYRAKKQYSIDEYENCGSSAVVSFMFSFSFKVLSLSPVWSALLADAGPTARLMPTNTVLQQHLLESLERWKLWEHHIAANPWLWV